MRETRQERFLKDMFGSDMDFYEKFLKDLSEEELQKFLDDHPEFLKE